MVIDEPAGCQILRHNTRADDVLIDNKEKGIANRLLGPLQ